MRFPSTSILLSLPLLGAAAEEGVFAQYRAQFQNALGSLGSYLQAPSPSEAAADANAEADAAAGAASIPEAKVQAVVRPTEELTLDGWKNTLYSRVKPDATTPEEWWVLITGGNKTCFGHCGNVETAFNESAPRISSVVDGPHTAILNCDAEQILCNSWSASPGYLYVFELLPKPTKTDIFVKRLNLTTTTSETIYELYESQSKESFQLLDSYFHPLDGVLATNGVAVPIGYILWVFGAVPSWMMMLVISFASRTMMGRRAGPPARAGAGAGGAAPAAR